MLERKSSALDESWLMLKDTVTYW